MLSLPDWETLPLQQQVAQLIVVRASGHLFDQQIEYPQWEPANAILRRWVQELGVGGVILLGGTAAEVGLRTQQLQEWASLPLLLAADIEEGVGQRFAGGTWFPPPLALSAIAQQDWDRALIYAEQMGRVIAQESVAIGLNWLLAPVVDVNNNSANPVINLRAFGEDPQTVSRLIQAFIQGAKAFPVLTSAKHFPGHGDTATDSHLDLPVLPHDRTRLEQIEWVPFVQAIAAGVDSVMTAHLQLPALDNSHPATLSAAILTGELRQQLGFNGLIVTDALMMGAITQRYGVNEAPLLALEAGADILLMPVDPEGAIQAICSAVAEGRIAPERIHASLERIWQAKRACAPEIRGGMSHAWEQTPPPPIQLEQLAQPPALATAVAILRDSMQVSVPAGSRLQLDDRPRRNLILVDDAVTAPFLDRQSPAITIPRELGYRLQVVDNNTPPIPLDRLFQPQQLTLLQLFIRGNPFRGSAGLSQTAQDWLNFLVQTDQLQALVIYGSPYGMETLVAALPADAPYAFTYGQMAAAQAIVLQALFAPGQKQQAIDQFTD